MTKPTFDNILNWRPVVKISQKMIHIDQIHFGNEEVSQSRLKSIDSDKSKDLERSIRAVGMKNPIHIEVNQWCGNYENSTFIGRDGNHRYGAKCSIFDKTNAGKSSMIECVVYEKNNNRSADLEWKIWQHSQNSHIEAICLPNSMEDSAHLLSTMLFAGKLCVKANKAIAANDWGNPAIEDALRKYMTADEAFKTRSLSDKDKLVEMVYTINGKVYHHKIKRYTQNNTKALIKSKFGVATSGSVSNCGNRIVRVANTNDVHAQMMAFFKSMINGEWKPGMENILVFH